ncbi:MAG: uroporphyrinogen decarboxylase family protein [Prolixibacteraceae bacterium]
MNSKERIRKAIHHAEPDRIPYDLGGTTVTSITKNAYRSAMKYRGLSPEYQAQEIDPVSQIVTPTEENLVYLGSDTRRIGAQRIPEYGQRKKRDGKTEFVTDFYGCDWKWDPEKDLYFNQISYPLEKYDTLSESVQFLYRPDWNDYLEILQRDLAGQMKTTEGYCCLADRHVAGLTENSLRIRGYEKWYMDTVIDPAGVEALLDIIVEDKIRYWDAVIDWAAQHNCQDQIDVIAECDDLGSQSSTIIDPETLRQMIIPRFRLLFGHLKKRLPGVKLFMHSCGAIRTILPDLIDAGLDILNPVQYTATGMELAGLKRDFGRDLVFWGGGIDTQTTLNNGTPDEVREVVKKVLDIMAPGGGFVFAPVHNIQDDVSPENFWAMWETLQEYGKY